MISTLNLLAAAVVLFQESPEEVFRKIQSSITNARTIRVSYSTQAMVFANGKLVRNDMSGTLLLKGSQQMAHRLKTKQDGKAIEASWFSNGRWRSRSKGTPVRASALLCSNDRLGLAFGGYWHALGAATTLKEKDYSKAFKGRNFRLSAGDGDVRTLTYELVVEEVPDGRTVTVWYDTATYALRRQRVDWKNEVVEASHDEKYDVFRINEEIADSEFELPADKEAEALLRKMEEKATTAKTLDVDFRTTIEMGTSKEKKDKATMAGTLQVKGARANYSYVTGLGGKETLSITVCDGEKSRLLVRPADQRQEPDIVRDIQDPAVAFGVGQARRLIRQGLGTTMFYPKDILREGATSVVGLVRGEDEGKERTLTWVIDYPEMKLGSIEMKLWYDPETLRPLRRLMKLIEGEYQSESLETYEKFVIDGDIPEDRFKLPERRK